MIPSLKKIMPVTVAQHIPGIEPIKIYTTIEIGETYIDSNTVEFYWVKVPYDPFEIFLSSYNEQTDTIKKMVNWCTESFGSSTEVDPRWVLYNEHTFCFKERRHRDWFLLKWST